MEEIDRLAADNARLTAILKAQGFRITYNPKTGSIQDVKPPARPRKPVVKHTAVTWARKRGFKGSIGLVRTITKDRAVGYRKFKNVMERSELIRQAINYLRAEGFTVHSKFFNKVPTYVLKNNDFYENVNMFIHYGTEEDDSKALDDQTIRESINLSIERIKRLHGGTLTKNKKLRSGIRASRASLNDLQDTGIKAKPKAKDKKIKNIVRAIRK